MDIFDEIFGPETTKKEEPKDVYDEIFGTTQTTDVTKTSCYEEARWPSTWHYKIYGKCSAYRTS